MGRKDENQVKYRDPSRNVILKSTRILDLSWEEKTCADLHKGFYLSQSCEAVR